MQAHPAPTCPGDGFPMVSTIAGWRCPICGLALIRAPRTAGAGPRAAHPAGGPHRGSDPA